MLLSDKPVRKDQVLQKVQIKELSKKGDGIVRVEGLVIFVPHTAVGDVVDLVIKNVGFNFAEAEVV